MKPEIFNSSWVDDKFILIANSVFFVSSYFFNRYYDYDYDDDGLTNIYKRCLNDKDLCYRIKILRLHNFIEKYIKSTSKSASRLVEMFKK